MKDSDGETARVPDPAADDEPTLDTFDHRFAFVSVLDATGQEIWIIDDGTPYSTAIVPREPAPEGEGE
jgi:hypothetical protein